MRTTLTLDDDVASLVKEEMRKRGGGWKETVNQLIRQGLRASAPKRAKFTIQPFTVESNPGINLDNIEDALNQLEGDDRR